MSIKCPYCKLEFEPKESKQRSLPQNSYYWAVLIKTLSDETGYSTAEIHEMMKAMFLRDIKHLKLKNGNTKEVVIIRSTASLKTVEAEEYYSKIRMFAGSELGIVLPLPNEDTEWLNE